MMDVPFRVQFAAEQAVKVAAELCGTDRPSIEWTELPGGIHGQTRGASEDTIFMDPRGMGPGKAMLTAAHETRHLHKMRIGSLRRYGAARCEKRWAEADAREFEGKALRALADRYGTSAWFQGAVGRCSEISPDELREDD